MGTWIFRFSWSAIVVAAFVVVAYVVAPNPVRPGLRVIEGTILPMKREACASVGNSCAPAPAPLEIDVDGRRIRLSVESTILDDSCADDVDSERRLRVYGDLRADLSEMTPYQLEVECGRKWALLERWPRRSAAALVN